MAGPVTNLTTLVAILGRESRVDDAAKDHRCARAALDESVAMLRGADDQIHQSHTLELLEAILAIAFLTGGLTATLRSDSAQLTLLAVSVAVLGVATVGLAVLW